MQLFTTLLLAGQLAVGGSAPDSLPAAVATQASVLSVLANSPALARPDAPRIKHESRSTDVVIIRSIKLTGNFRTRDRIILREMAFRMGDTVQVEDFSNKLSWSQRNLNNTNLFVTVDVAACQGESDYGQRHIPDQPLEAVDVEVVMKERWYVFVYPVFDIADRNFNEWWYERGRDFRRTIYGGHVSIRNLSGNNDNLRVALEAGFTHRLGVSYQLPYLDRGQRTGLRIDAAYSTNKDVAYRTTADKLVYTRSEKTLRQRFSAGLTLTHRSGLYYFHSLEVRHWQNQIADTIAHLNPDYFLDGQTRQQYQIISYNFRYDRRDNVAYPLRGVVWSVSASKAGLLPANNLWLTELSGTYNRFMPLGGKFYGGTGMKGWITMANRQPYAALRGIGSSLNVLRGYELYLINGQRAWMWQNSLRYQLFNVHKHLSWVPVRQFNTLPIAAYITLFGDTGYVQSNVADQYNSRLANRLLYSAGIGVDVVTFYNLVGRFSVSMNAQRQTGIFFNVAQSL